MIDKTIGGRKKQTNHAQALLSSRLVNLPGLGVTKGLSVNISVSKFFDPAKALVRFFASHSYLTGVIAAHTCQT